MPDNTPTLVPFHYIKSNLFRVTHVDGAIGSLTPSGLIFVSLYSERAAIPQIMMHEITDTGQVGVEHQSERVGKTGIVREIEIGAVMSVETATSLVTWLQQQIELMQKLRNTASKQLEKEQDAPLH